MKTSCGFVEYAYTSYHSMTLLRQCYKKSLLGVYSK